MLKNILLKIDTEGDPFKYLGSDNIIDEDNKSYTAILSYGQSWYELLIVVGLLGLLVSIVIIGIRFMITKSADKRTEIKQILNTKLIIAMAFFSIDIIIGFAVTIAKNLI